MKRIHLKLVVKNSKKQQELLQKIADTLGVQIGEPIRNWGKEYITIERVEQTL